MRDSGGVSWSGTPSASLPGSAEGALLVRVLVDNPDTIDQRRLDRLIAAAKPAHVLHRVEVVGP